LISRAEVMNPSIQEKIIRLMKKIDNGKRIART